MLPLPLHGVPARSQHFFWLNFTPVLLKSYKYAQQSLQTGRMRKVKIIVDGGDRF